MVKDFHLKRSCRKSGILRSAWTCNFDVFLLCWLALGHYGHFHQLEWEQSISMYTLHVNLLKCALQLKLVTNTLHMKQIKFTMQLKLFKYSLQLKLFMYTLQLKQLRLWNLNSVGWSPACNNISGALNRLAFVYYFLTNNSPPNNQNSRLYL